MADILANGELSSMFRENGLYRLTGGFLNGLKNDFDLGQERGSCRALFENLMGLHKPNNSGVAAYGSWKTTRAPNEAATSVTRHPGRNPHSRTPNDCACDVASLTHKRRPSGAPRHLPEFLCWLNAALSPSFLSTDFLLVGPLFRIQPNPLVFSCFVFFFLICPTAHKIETMEGLKEWSLMVSSRYVI